ncbi:hypothetical protein MRX96_032441 [Rhipicephalus microplus]
MPPASLIMAQHRPDLQLGTGKLWNAELSLHYQRDKQRKSSGVLRSTNLKDTGLIAALTGVALLDLAEIYDASISSVSFLITTRGIGSLSGSILGGKLYDTYNTQVVSVLTMTLSSVTVLMIPLSGYLEVVHAVVFFEGLSLGAFAAGKRSTTTLANTVTPVARQSLVRLKKLRHMWRWQKCL